MEFHIVFKVKLRAHGEVSPAFIQRLRVTKQYIDQVFGPSNATVRDEADVRCCFRHATLNQEASC